ncbi:hypothetical protein [Amycolatopsis cihanbeyliensis]|uniref:Uncharacterized protein n=1 Tax=Amycolatopsis cihanbeyliensis TaxID=1128664 RepID=A0A542DBI4_AMYCI|nr:hypothetical protein [Amycolatopsis cihanbeyliensis]TQJ00413.1 hypothetical protein FB471_0034 [Amycolatopsis cihanbeyliensis]
MSLAIWVWHRPDGMRYAIEPNDQGGYDTVVESGLEARLDREQWATLEDARSHFREALATSAERGEEGAEGALAELDRIGA